MKKLLLVCLVVPFTFFYSFSQGVGSDLELPMLVPQSPNAYELGKYGEVDVNESTGSISPSIPLYTYKAGNISVPISLAYSGNGVKVDQRPTTIGINWSLIAGGVITRQIRDRADELAYNTDPIYNNRRFYDYASLNAISGSDDDTDPNTPFASVLKEITDNTEIDTEVDIYNYNFMGYSGSFYIDENWEPQLIKYDKEIKIDISELDGTDIVNGITIDKPEITITTSDGVKYLFGGNIEDGNVNSGTEYSNSQRSDAPLSTADMLFTSLYLVEIEHPNGDTVNFEYKYDDFYQPRVGTYQSVSETTYATGQCTLTLNNPHYSDLRTAQLLTRIEHGRYLNKIRSSRTNEIVEFVLDDTNPKFKNVLESIKVIETSGQGNSLIKEFDLNYQVTTKPGDASIDERFFLIEVDELNSNGNSSGKTYTMEYDNPQSLPSKFSYAQDHYGYYNGKESNNASGFLIPTNVVPGIESHYGQFADREADFNYAKLGSLVSIKYPTGGKTIFEYESGIDLTRPIASNTKNDILKLYYNFGFYNEMQLSDNINIAPQLNENGSTDIPATQTVTALYTINTTGSIGHSNWVKIIVKEQGTSNVIASKNVHIENPENSLKLYEDNFSFSIVQGTNYEVIYKFVYGSPGNEIDGLNPNTVNSSNEISAFLRYEYALNAPPSYADALGIRIKSITNKLADDSGANYKRYYYNSKENIQIDNGVYTSIEDPKEVFFPKYDYLSDGIEACSSGGAFDPYTSHTIQSSSLTSLFIDDSSKKMYPIVTVSYGGNNFENGGKEMHYIVKGDGFPNPYKGRQIFTSNRDNNSWKNGTLQKEYEFSKSNDIFNILKEVEYKYKEVMYQSNPNLSKKVVNVIAQGIGNPPGPPNIDLINIGLYETYSRWHGIDSIISKEYFGINALTTIQTFDYEGDLAGIPTHEITTNSDGLKTFKRTYYPDEIVSTSYLGHDNLTSDEWNAIQRMKRDNQFNIATPIQVEIYSDINQNDVFENNELLNTQRTNYYDDLLVNQNIFIPQSIETAKDDNALESRITYHSYYENGNIKEVSKTHGASIVYVWGYDEQYPIAKIENATYADINAALNASGFNTSITNIQSSSDIDTEEIFRLNLDKIRQAMPDAMVTTYTYDPPIGVTSITDPRGRTVYYHYDDFNRLEFVKDHDGNVLNKNEYNYAPQN